MKNCARSCNCTLSKWKYNKKCLMDHPQKAERLNDYYVNNINVLILLTRLDL